MLNREIYVLVNKKGGGVMALSTMSGSSCWTHPSDPTADVAVIPVNQDSAADYLAIALKNFATPESMRAQNIGIGDEVFITGLFAQTEGTKRNMPIVRHGNIAMIPEEQIWTDGYADVYLVEARSIGGLSGSPVFVRPTVFVHGTLPDGTRTKLHGIGDTYSLLGLMHGHWDVKESEMNAPSFVHDRKRGVNLGIGIVVPATKIIETINRPELVEMRKEFEEQFVRDHTPGTDSAKKTQFTRTDFEVALKKVSRKIGPRKR